MLRALFVHRSLNARTNHAYLLPSHGLTPVAVVTTSTPLRPPVIGWSQCSPVQPAWQWHWGPCERINVYTRITEPNKRYTHKNTINLLRSCLVYLVFLKPFTVFLLLDQEHVKRALEILKYHVRSLMFAMPHKNENNLWVFFTSGIFLIPYESSQRSQLLKHSRKDEQDRKTDLDTDGFRDNLNNSNKNKNIFWRFKQKCFYCLTPTCAALGWQMPCRQYSLRQAWQPGTTPGFMWLRVKSCSSWLM